MSGCMQMGNQFVQCKRGSANGSAIDHTVAPCSAIMFTVRERQALCQDPWHPKRPEITLQAISGHELPTKYPQIQLAVCFNHYVHRTSEGEQGGAADFVWKDKDEAEIHWKGKKRAHQPHAPKSSWQPLPEGFPQLVIPPQ